MSVKWRIRMAWALIILTVIGWPLSAFTFASSEPQFILGLSWFAVTLTAVDVLGTQDVRGEQEEEKP
jgi:hypothetical protein